MRLGQVGGDPVAEEETFEAGPRTRRGAGRGQRQGGPAAAGRQEGGQGQEIREWASFFCLGRGTRCVDKSSLGIEASSNSRKKL